MGRERRGEWEKRIEGWKSSGQTGAEYAAGVGVKEATLRHWKWRLEREKKSGAQAGGGVGFVRVVAAPAGEPIEIQLGDGVRIRVPEQFDVEALRRVLEVVRVG
jgi:hypothetical protein